MSKGAKAWLEVGALILSHFVWGWVLMLTLGALHLDAFPAVPLLGYWPCFGVSMVLAPWRSIRRHVRVSREE